MGRAPLRRKKRKKKRTMRMRSVAAASWHTAWVSP
jgi:hypothetical protein